MATYPYKPPVQNKFLTVPFADISTAETRYVYPGFQGKIKKITVVTNVAITLADSTVTASIGSGGSPVAVTGGAVTVAFTGSGDGSVFTASPTALNTFSATDPIKLVNNGNSTTASPALVTLELVPL